MVLTHCGRLEVDAMLAVDLNSQHVVNLHGPEAPSAEVVSHKTEHEAYEGLHLEGREEADR
jgi:hypothetical protein